MAKETLNFLKVGTEWVELEIISEADVVLTAFGYAPFLRIKKITTDSEHGLYISAKSLAAPLEELRKNNGGVFEGIQFRVRKESADQRAQYEVEISNSLKERPKLSVKTGKGFHDKLRSSEDIRKKLEKVLLN